jgi:hypothetical protein
VLFGPRQRLQGGGGGDYHELPRLPATR